MTVPVNHIDFLYINMFDFHDSFVSCPVQVTTAKQLLSWTEYNLLRRLHATISIKVSP